MVYLLKMGGSFHGKLLVITRWYFLLTMKPPSWPSPTRCFCCHLSWWIGGQLGISKERRWQLGPGRRRRRRRAFAAGDTECLRSGEAGDGVTENMGNSWDFVGFHQGKWWFNMIIIWFLMWFGSSGRQVGWWFTEKLTSMMAGVPITSPSFKDSDWESASQEELSLASGND